MVIHICHPSTGKCSQEDPWESLASETSLLKEFQASEGYHSKTVSTTTKMRKKPVWLHLSEIGWEASHQVQPFKPNAPKSVAAVSMASELPCSLLR